MGDRFLVIHSDYIDGDNDGPYRDGRPGDIIISADQLRVMDGGVLDAYLQLAHDGYQVTIESSTGPILIDGVELGDHVDRHLGSGSDSLYAVAVDAPNALDDANDGYGIGSRWINVTDGYEYVCIDATAGAAVWKNTTAGAGTGGAGISASEHRTLRHLIHFIDNGPTGGFASGAFKEIIGGIFPTSIIWYEDVTKAKKIVEKTITRSGGGATLLKPTPIVWKMYDTDGATVLTTVSDAITYTFFVPSSVTRTIS